MASWFVRLFPERAVRIRALTGDTVLCSWARHLILTMPLSTQVYKWVPAICWGNLTNRGGVTCDGLAYRPGGVEILLPASCYRNCEKLRQLSISHGCKASLLLLLLLLLLQYRLSTIQEKPLTGADVLRLKGEIILLKV